MLNCIPLVTSKSYNAAKAFDSLLIVAKTLSDLKAFNISDLHDSLGAYKERNAAFEKDLSFVVSNDQRIIYSPIGPINDEIDDVRRVSEASYKAVKKAIAVGSRTPLLINCTRNDFVNSDSVALLGALEAAYTPQELREIGNAPKLEKLGFYHENETEASKLLTIVNAIEIGRTVTRDIAGGDPERMAAPRVLEYVEETFNMSAVKISVIQGQQEFEKNYPCFAAVNRAAEAVPRHKGNIIKLEYTPPEDQPIDTTVFLVGKGITYDTGGADIKYGGCMAGMHRDKSGAAFVAGFFKVLSLLKPKGLKVFGTMCMARNSVGEECYVSDEIITSRANVRIRIGNTDAEGRMVMTDTLCEAKELAQNAVNPYLFTIATLTGHVIRAYGPSYAAIMCNGVGRAKNLDSEFKDIGEKVADPWEISTIRREDYACHKGKSEYEHVLQANTKPSSETPRGHQGPAAYLIMASGLDKHGLNTEKPLPYAHCDIAGSSGFPPDLPTASPLTSFAHRFIVPRL